MYSTYIDCPDCGELLQSELEPTSPSFFTDRCVFVVAWCENCGWRGEVGFDFEEDPQYVKLDPPPRRFRQK